MSSSHPNYDTHTYLTVLLQASSPLIVNPSALATAYPGLTVVGPVGDMRDIQIVGIPKSVWAQSSGTITDALARGEGVLKVDVQEPRTRAKRG